MNRHRIRSLVFVIAALLAAPAGVARAQAAPPDAPPPGSPPTESPPPASTPSADAGAPTPEHPAPEAATARPTTQVDFLLGARGADVSGSSWKFEEFGRTDEGFVLDHVRALSTGRRPGDWLELEVARATEDDEAYGLTVGRQDRFRLRLEYQAVPHLFAHAYSLWGGFGTGRLQIADVAQAQLEANEQLAAERGPAATTDPVTDTTGEDAIQQGIVRGLYSATDRRTFGLDRERFGAALEVNLSEAASVWVRVRNENRDGTRPIGTGSYERWAQVADTIHVADRFIVYGAELPEPLDYRTFGVSAGAGLHGERWTAEAEYGFTQFRNFEKVLLWDNPFRITDEDQDGSLNRSRFVVGQLVLPPESASHDLSVTGAIELPLHGTLSAAASYGIVTQDDSFFPYTRNTAIQATDLAGNPAGPAASLALPARDLNGDVRTIAGTVAAGIRPVAPVAVNARYRLYRYDNESSVITFPGYAAFGESGWRTERNDVTAAQDALVRNEPFGYWRHEAELEADVRVARMLSVFAEIGSEWWRFEHLRLDQLDEYSAGGGVVFRPLPNTSVKARYRYAQRTSDGYLRGSTAENPEARGLLNYNWSDRTRHLVDVRVQYAPTRVVSFGVLGRLVDDDHGGDTEGGTAIDQFRFGRTDLRRWLGSINVGVTPADRLSFTASYSIEQRRERMAAAAKDDAGKATDDFGFGDNYAPENYWNSQIDEWIHSVDLGATFQLLPERLFLDAGYSLSLSDMDVDTANPNPLTATTLANAVANPWPTITNRLHSIYGELSYAVSPRIRAGLRYLYETYDVDDFAWDTMDPYMAGRSVENSTRMVFADATYDTYDAHVGTVYVAGSF